MSGTSKDSTLEECLTEEAGNGDKQHEENLMPTPQEEENCKKKKKFSTSSTYSPFRFELSLPPYPPAICIWEAVIKKKYGGFLPKKKPLISKDHERAFFDSADWALGKGGQKPKGPLEALLPKLQPTPHHQARSRHSSYAPADGEDMATTTTSDAEEDHGNSGEQEKSSESFSDHN